MKIKYELSEPIQQTKGSHSLTNASATVTEWTGRFLDVLLDYVEREKQAAGLSDNRDPPRWEPAYGAGLLALPLAAILQELADVVPERLGVGRDTKAAPLPQGRHCRWTRTEETSGELRVSTFPLLAVGGEAAVVVHLHRHR